MATKTTKKYQPKEIPEIEGKVIQSGFSEEENTEPLNAEKKDFVFIPDMPAQMEDEIIEEDKNYAIGVDEYSQHSTISTVENFEIKEKNKSDSDEILFLKQILQHQHSGGFGRHLDDEINERIKYLRSCL